MNGNSTGPYFGNLEQLTLQNTYFRQVLFTGEHSQLVLMCLQPSEEIGSEVHSDVDQFFRIEEGEAKFVTGNNEENLVKAGEAAVIPAGTEHNVINTSAVETLKLYTIYSPANHPSGTIHKTKMEAEAAHGREAEVDTEPVDQEPIVEPSAQATEPAVEPPAESTTEPTVEPTTETTEPTPAPEIPEEPAVTSQTTEESNPSSSTDPSDKQI